MKPTLNILFIEDAEDDTLFIVKEIEKAGYQVAWEIFTTEEDMYLLKKQG